MSRKRKSTSRAFRRDWRPPPEHERRDIPLRPSCRGGIFHVGWLSLRGRGWKPTLSASIAAFIARIDSIYLGTADATGQPYIQHRGGPPGFLRVIDSRTLAFADFSGNQQYISVGHLAANPKAFLFLMEYERRQRIKIFGTARVSCSYSRRIIMVSSVLPPSITQYSIFG